MQILDAGQTIVLQPVDRADQIISQHFHGKSLHGPVLHLAQDACNDQLKAEGFCERVLIESIDEDGTLHIAVHFI